VNAEYGYPDQAMPSAPPDNFHDLLGTMKRAAAALREAEIDFLVGGGLAIWARGGPPTDHDVDLYVREEDALRSLEALVDAGFREDRPPEDWLYKAWDGDNLVDLIFRPAGGSIEDAHFERATLMEVNAQRVLVASIDDVLVTKLLAMTEQEPDYRSILEVARSLREQVDWNDVEARTKKSPFARAFFTLGEGLGIVERRTVLRPAHVS
jgi:Aminoglycoside-2''-adenylyltransferase